MHTDSWKYHADRVADVAAESSSLGIAGLFRGAVEESSAGPLAFDHACQTYRDAALECAAASFRKSEPAARYRSMEEFWRDAEDQKLARSERSFWDTYEHGKRRQLEGILARSAGASDAVLVNSGMTAMDVGLRSLGLQPGDVLLAGEFSYFETSEYLSTVLPSAGIRVARDKIATAADLQKARLQHRPRAILVETFLNGPELVPAPDIAPALTQGVKVLVDNSVLGHACPWIARFGHPNLLVVESGLKYLCQRTSCGVIYGSGPLIAAARDYARRVGVALQNSALFHLRPHELTSSGTRIRIHGQRRRQFIEALSGGPWAWVRDARNAQEQADPAVGELLKEAGGGPLTFLRLAASDAAVSVAHREVCRKWSELMRAEGRSGWIQAGFGWDSTTMRAYDTDRLNRAGAGAFLRVSVGIGPVADIQAAAALLNTAGEAALQAVPRREQPS